MHGIKHRRRAMAVAVAAAMSLVTPVAWAHGPDFGEHGAVDQQTTRNLIPELGFFVHPWAAVEAPTSIEWGDDGRLYATTIDGRVLSFSEHEIDGNEWLGSLDTRLVADGFGQLLGVEVAGNSVYVADSHDGVGRVSVIELDSAGVEASRAVVLDGLPQGRHNTNDLELNPSDGLLYVTNGNQTDNGTGDCGAAPAICEAPLSGTLLRLDPASRDLVVGADGAPPSGVEIVARRMRNVYDVAFWPSDSSLAYLPMNGSDSPASDDLLYRVDVDDQDSATTSTTTGKHKKAVTTTVTTSSARVDDMGFPLCLYGAHENQVGADPEDLEGTLEPDDHGAHGSIEPVDNPMYYDAATGAGERCPASAVSKPVASFGGHVSANGADFARGGNFACAPDAAGRPCTYGNDLFVAEWGSLWGAEDAHFAGRKVVRVEFRDDGTIAKDEHGMPKVREFLTGGAPIDVAFRPADGTMFVADMGGTIYKVFWHTPDAVGPADPADANHGHEGHRPGHEETVLVDGHGALGTPFEGHRVTWERQYRTDENGEHGDDIEYNAVVYDGPGDLGHGHGGSVCQPTSEQQAYADALLAASHEAMAQYQGWDGFARAKAHNFWPYPVTESKLVHMTNTSRGSGDQEHVWRPGEASEQPPLADVFGFYGEGYYYEERPWTLNPWRVESFVYGLVDDVDADPSNGESPGPAVINIMFTFNARDAEGHVKTPPNPTGCLLQWHAHTGVEGAATSFDTQQPTESGYMAHVYLWGPLRNQPWEARLNAGEAHGWFRPFNLVPATCNDAPACIP